MRRILRLAAGLGLAVALLLAGPLWMLATERAWRDGLAGWRAGGDPGA
ncbi:hypothetical protein [Halomonas sp. LBP4]|nr:hypothetical protein [Halomonas sp. LBP4]